MSKVLLFYKYVNLENPTAIASWQRTLCNKLSLTGRIILAHEGINGTVGGTLENINHYVEAMRAFEPFASIDFKESEGGADCFPRLRIVVKNEIVNFGIDPQKIQAKDGGKHLTPEEAHNLLSNKPENLIVLDGRNKYEADIGTFVDAVIPNIQYFRQFPAYIDENQDMFKDKQVLMFCTGGIRCERASAYLKSKGITQEVYQIEGGIHRYIEKYPDGFFRGKNYVFDNRVIQPVNNDVLGTCMLCSTACDDYTNCLNAECNKHFICCPPCKQQFNNTCSSLCKELVEQGKVSVRPQFNKINSMANRMCEL